MKRATTGNQTAAAIVNFNPRPHEEGDSIDRIATKQIVISIHALMKRATKLFKEYNRRDVISIHALMKRATRISPAAEAVLAISIHALMKRATNSVSALTP